ncbi:MAG TPA: hypothetical protein VKU01_20895 [Bryobacteraceae bacterium]|nr:hypothetical protein [Bryobacteraceae bacterium]
MTLASAALGCPNCQGDLPRELWNLDYESYCPRCKAPLAVVAFPAIARQTAGVAPELVTEGAEASCFYHPGKRAAVACDQCGRFLCSLCQVELSGQNWCPNCIERRRNEGKMVNLERRRTLYDNMALVLATLPALMLWPSLICAPMSLFVSIRYWRAPSSIVPRTKVRFILAIVISLLEIAGWVFLVMAMVFAFRQRQR